MNHYHLSMFESMFDYHLPLIIEYCFPSNLTSIAKKIIMAVLYYSDVLVTDFTYIQLKQIGYCSGFFNGVQ